MNVDPGRVCDWPRFPFARFSQGPKFPTLFYRPASLPLRFIPFSKQEIRLVIKLRMPGIIENMLFATVLTCICGAAMPAAAQTRGAVRPEGTKLVPPPRMAEASPMAKERELLC